MGITIQGSTQAIDLNRRFQRVNDGQNLIYLRIRCKRKTSIISV